jgi:hypothetical protein
MIFADGFLGLLTLGLWLFCIIDVITTPPENVRNLPKIAWIFIVILLYDIGSIVWLIAGRNWNRSPVATSGGRPMNRPVATNPDDDEDFQRFLRQRAEQQRRRAREADQGGNGTTPDQPN